MSIALWILQAVLAVVYLLHGWMFVVWPPGVVERMRQRSATPNQEVLGISPRLRQSIGVAEWLAALGLILPGLTGILPWLTPLAAFGLMIVMAGAIVYHLRRRETQSAVPTAFLFVLAQILH